MRRSRPEIVGFLWAALITIIIANVVYKAFVINKTPNYKNILGGHIYEYHYKNSVSYYLNIWQISAAYALNILFFALGIALVANMIWYAIEKKTKPQEDSSNL